MITADEIQRRPAQNPFSTIGQTAQIRLNAEVAIADPADSGRRGELTLSGSQVLVGCVLALCAMGLLWALIKLWLFEP